MTEPDQAATLPGGISRRRVLHGAAWATPAVLIATASPPAAASTTPGEGVATMGALTLMATTSAYNEEDLYMTSTVSYASDAYAAPVTDLTLAFEVPTKRITKPEPTIVSGAGWTYTGAKKADGNTVFTFARNGSPLRSADLLTTPLSIRVAKNKNLDAVEVGAVANGLSTGQPVPPARARASAALASNAPVFNSGTPARHQEWFASNPRVDAWVIDGALRWTGPWHPPGPSVADIEIEWRFPAAEVVGTILPWGQGLGSGWVEAAPAQRVGDAWVVRHRFNGAIGSGTQTTSGLQFAVPTSVRPTVVDYVITSRSAGQQLVTTGRVYR